MSELLQHKHILIRAEVKNPLKDETQATEWLKDLVKKINMKILIGPIAKYLDVPGNRGLTVAAIIETSHIVMHCWDECSPGLMQLDVYTCGAFDPKTVLDAIEQFDIIKIDYKYLDRESGFQELSL
jgi:S-adenosylmethionine/arginine decarboxylase-like enzyme